MKIGVVSDTHSREIPQQMVEDFKKVDFILHAGDLCSIEDYEKIKSINELKAVCGNMDNSEVKKQLPRRQIIECGKIKIGLFHGEGPPQTLLNRVKSEFESDSVDVVVFGHSHYPLNKKMDGVLFFNPGSPNDDLFAPYCSYGIIDVNDDIVEGHIVRVKEL